MNIIAVIGTESHTTSRGWAKVSVNGQQVTHREATSKEFLTKYGDKHAMWVECILKVEPGDTITWEAGANAGSRGSEHTRQNLTLIADPDAEVYETKDIGYPASNAKLRGRLRLESDADQEQATNHAALKASL